VDYEQEHDSALDEKSDAAWPENDKREFGSEARQARDPGDDSDAPVRLDDTAAYLAPLPIDEDIVADDVQPDDVRAENVSVSKSGANSIEATTVSINQGGAARVRADEVSLEQSGLFMARAGKLTVKSDASAFAVVADEATVEEGANVFLLVAGKVSGNVRPLIDWRAGLAFGGGLAIGLAILRRLR
jgi:hypothetical protein